MASSHGLKEVTGRQMRRILIVDDERDVCECLTEFFKTKGCTVASVFSGEEALDRLEQDAADVVVLDILLPGLSGIEILRRVHERDPHIRVVMLTGINEAELRRKARSYGAVGYITKPFDFSETTWSAVFAEPPPEQSHPAALPSA